MNNVLPSYLNNLVITKYRSVSIHHKKPLALTIDIFEIKNNVAPNIVNNLFMLRLKIINILGVANTSN